MIAITGATGHLGLATINALLPKVAPTEIVAVVRDPQKAASTLPQGLTVRTGDYNDPASLLAAFQGVETVVLISSSELENDARIREHRNVIDAAKQAGVRHLIYTSIVNPSPESAFNASPSHFSTEEYLRASGLAYTVFRNTLYLDIIPMLVGEGKLPSSKLYSSAGDGKVSYGLRAEMGEALANVLTSEGHENQVYDIAPGPAYSFQDLAATLSEVTGQPVEYVSVSGEEIAAGMRQHQVPEPFVNLLLGMHQAMKNGEFAMPSTTFEQLLGRKPMDLKTYLTSVYGK
ncbi:SDR family oxidoreductase [Hymenobacter negativus]|uniref:SDR family oxidoreductase n=1 Tax=Hymenobacter negativus TaxID=2795026 RepID=A0ABS3QEM6_9BACT|nr:SDR family oxidoreductase [Hymenobacter negativus]MBO2009438.1 SDR family oxidoreductase [Hymenobacter negativus]